MLIIYTKSLKLQKFRFCSDHNAFGEIFVHRAMRIILHNQWNVKWIAIHENWSISNSDTVHSRHLLYCKYKDHAIAFLPPTTSAFVPWTLASSHLVKVKTNQRASWACARWCEECWTWALVEPIQREPTEKICIKMFTVRSAERLYLAIVIAEWTPFCLAYLNWEAKLVSISLKHQTTSTGSQKF